MSETRVAVRGRAGGCWGFQALGDDIYSLSRYHTQFLTAFCFKDEKQRLGKAKVGPTEVCAWQEAGDCRCHQG